ncbi:MAG: exopolyphosphatase [bacterium]|nr:exopolyphosphatase [bacterium]
MAAVDLGSNSFHLVVAQDVDGEPRQVDKLRERVALASGLTSDHRLDDAAQQRAFDCLERFAQRLAGLTPDRIRAVGTATFRRFRKGRKFHERAEEVLGHEIEVLAGREEARLIYLGVAHSLAEDVGRRLVIDIGGASTECILGKRFESESEACLSMGCVTFTQQFFKKGEATRKALERAETAARLQLETIEAAYRDRGWKQCVGSSGTILAISEILRRQGWTQGEITSDGLDALRDAVLSAKQFQKIELDGLKPDRRGVIVAGVAILRGAFASLEIERMATSTGALREGLLYDLLGRIHHEDVRDRSVGHFARRHGVDEAHAQRVARTALELLQATKDTWGLGKKPRRLLEWSATLHAVGLSVSYSGHHRHGAYLVENADLPGFSRQEQAQIAALVHCHRRKFRREILDAFAPSRAKTMRRLAVLLRLAVRLHRNRGTLTLPATTFLVAGSVLRLSFPAGWLAAHPLTRADVEDEAQLLTALGFELQVV